MTATIYSFDSYRQILEDRLLGKERRGQLSRAAEMLGCQPSFLSRVIKSGIHLTPDQAFLLTEFWRLSSQEAEYFKTLVEYERAVAPRYKSNLFTKVNELKKQHRDLQKRIRKDNFSAAGKESLYFSSWHWSAIHFLSCIPEFQNLKKIAMRLEIPEALALSHLKQMQKFGLVQEEKGRWSYLSGQFHLPKNSPYVTLHHQNWRSRAVLDSQNMSSDGIHYTTVLTLSKSDLERLKELLLAFISESDRLAGPSTPQESAVLTCDLFKP